MVFLALVRDPARLHFRLLLRSGQAARCAGDVLGDPGLVLPALARQVTGTFGSVPPQVQDLLRHPRGGRSDPRILRRRAG